MKKEIEQWLLGTVFPAIGMDRPENFDWLVHFIENDVRETADPKNYHTGDFGIAFRRFLKNATEQKTIDDYYY